MKRGIVAVLIIVVSMVLFIVFTVNKEKADDVLTVYRFDFDTEEIDRDFWMVGAWETLERNYALARIRDGVLTLSADMAGTMPYMVTRPLAIREKDVITVKRKVRIVADGETFGGGFSMYQTNDLQMIPERTDGSWGTAFGDGVALIEYSKDLIHESERPGRDVFRFLAADWSYNDNYVLINPVYDEWVEEKFVFDTRSNQMTYTLGEKSYKLNSYRLDGDGVRFLMHPYGTGAGNRIEIDFIEVTIENKRVRGK